MILLELRWEASICFDGRLYSQVYGKTGVVRGWPGAGSKPIIITGIKHQGAKHPFQKDSHLYAQVKRERGGKPTGLSGMCEQEDINFWKKQNKK